MRELNINLNYIYIKDALQFSIIDLVKTNYGGLLDLKIYM